MLSEGLVGKCKGEGNGREKFRVGGDEEDMIWMFGMVVNKGH